MNERERVQFFYNVGYEFTRFDSYDYSILSKCPVDQARGAHKDRLNECFIMFDTETSKSAPDSYSVRSDGKKDYKENENYIVAWTLAINIYGWNIVCLYGSRPSELVDTIMKVNESLPGTKTIFYCHNLSYDWPFCKKFLIRELGAPIEQLNTKPHYPIDLTFIDGIHLRDSLILAQRSIERWANDFQVEHRKAVGSWDYNKIRHQGEELTEEEQLYIQNDVLAGVECLNALRKQLGKTYAGMPYTNTGIVRAEAKRRGKPHGAHAEAYKCYTDMYMYDLMEELYHGGYTHANRHYIGYVNEGNIRCYDEASAYPYVMLSEKYPVENFAPMGYDLTPEEVLMSDEALIFRFRACGVRLKDPEDPFPVLQVSKARKVVNGIFDNGRILETDYIDILCNEIDFQSIYSKYKWDACWIQEVYFAYKDYLPSWLTDFVYELFRRKTELKGGDPVEYAISKGMLNSVYIRNVCTETPEGGNKGRSRNRRVYDHCRTHRRKISKGYKKAEHILKLCLGYMGHIIRHAEHSYHRLSLRTKSGR